MVGTRYEDLTPRLQANEGTYFTALSPTPGTGIVGHAAPTTFDATKPYFLVYNGGNSSIIPVSLRLRLSAASVGNSIMQFTQVLDLGANRRSSAGTALTIQNTRSSSKNTSNAIIYQGAVVATAASASARVVSHREFRPVIGVVGDVYEFTWGALDSSTDAPATTTGSAQSLINFNFAPVIIGPGDTFLIHQWAASQSTGPTFEAEFGFMER